MGKDEPWSHFGCCGEEKIPVFVLAFEPHLSQLLQQSSADDSSICTIK
jgi:hypothetical protein